MISVNSIVVNSAIIHRLNNREIDGLALSDFNLDLNEEFKQVLSTHSTNSLEDKNVRYAKFNNPSVNEVYNLTTSFFSSRHNFIDYSHLIATRLFSFMTSKTISPGDLVISDVNINGERYMAILKLDHKDQYLSKIETMDDKMKISLVKTGNAWPEAGTRLQKAAFIRIDIDIEDEHKYDLIMLDRQNTQKSIDDEAVSQFFSTNFLNVKLIQDEITNTTSFIKGVRAIKDDSTSLNITDEKGLQIYNHAINLIKTAPLINIDNFLETFFNRETEEHEHFRQAKEIFKTYGLTRNEFEKSDEVSKIFLKNRRVFLDGIRLTIDHNVFNDPDKFSYKETKHPDGKKTVDISIKGVELKKLE
ncbi:nucleoid-associated protein [Bacillus sp. OxB-1]|uniref:nucleoid-associated protein n=1 Tax=Bacillus sp. (strain OxB-1) TaxID=98228 RepID=UPI000581FA9D|nr:nucleoid-associated protein [Bacillus sp. OxB-1]BAQ11359.1 nucleoid-associated protein [Bacillus sp. OxB-1]